MVRKSLLLIGFLSAFSFADTGFRSTIRVTETDNSPSCQAGQIKFSAGSVACAGNVATITNVSSATLPSGSTQYVQNNPSSTQTGAFNIASGTINGPFTVQDNGSGLAQITLESLSPGSNYSRIRIVDVGSVKGYMGWTNTIGIGSNTGFTWWDANGNPLLFLDLSSGTLKAYYNVTAASMTLAGLTNQNCIGTAANGNLQAGTCGGYALEPATVTIQANKGITASTAAFSSWSSHLSNVPAYFGASNNMSLQWSSVLGTGYWALPANVLGFLWSNNSRLRILADSNMIAQSGAALYEISNDDTNRPDFTASNFTSGTSGQGLFMDIYGDYFTAQHINQALQGNGSKGILNGIHGPNQHGLFQVVDSTNGVPIQIYQAGSGDPSQNLVDVRAATSWTTGNPSGSFIGKYVNFVNASTTVFTVGSDGALYSASSVTLGGMAAPSSPGNGTLWHDSSQKAFIGSVAGATQTLQGTLFTVIADSSVSNSNVETNLIGAGGQNLHGVSLLPANFFTPGKTVHVVARGYMSNNNAVNVTAKLYVGTTLIASHGPTSLSTLSSATWTLDGIITCRTAGASGTLQTQAQMPVAVSPATSYQLHMNNTETAGVDTTAAQQLKLSFTYGTANSNNKSTLTSGYAEVLN